MTGMPYLKIFEKITSDFQLFLTMGTRYVLPFRFVNLISFFSKFRFRLSNKDFFKKSASSFFLLIFLASYKDLVLYQSLKEYLNLQEIL